jgi:transcriptional regulator with XRE-family HTH domain
MRIYVPPSLGEALRSGRERKGLSQAQLAEVSGVSLRHIASVENGANISVGLLLILAAELEIHELKLGPLHLDLEGLSIEVSARRLAAGRLAEIEKAIAAVRIDLRKRVKPGSARKGRLN